MLLIPILTFPLISFIAWAHLLIPFTFLHSLLVHFILASPYRLLPSLIVIAPKAIATNVITRLNATALIQLHTLLAVLYHAVPIAVSAILPHAYFSSDCTFLGYYLSSLESLSSVWRTLRWASEYSMLSHSYRVNSRAFYHSAVSHSASANQRITRTHWTSSRTSTNHPLLDPCFRASLPSNPASCYIPQTSPRFVAP